MSSNTEGGGNTSKLALNSQLSNLLGMKKKISVVPTGPKAPPRRTQPAAAAASSRMPSSTATEIQNSPSSVPPPIEITLPLSRQPISVSLVGRGRSTSTTSTETPAPPPPQPQISLLSDLDSLMPISNTPSSPTTYSTEIEPAPVLEERILMPTTVSAPTRAQRQRQPPTVAAPVVEPSPTVSPAAGTKSRGSRGSSTAKLAAERKRRRQREIDELSSDNESSADVMDLLPVRSSRSRQSLDRSTNTTESTNTGMSMSTDTRVGARAEVVDEAPRSRARRSTAVPLNSYVEVSKVVEEKDEGTRRGRVKRERSAEEEKRSSDNTNEEVKEDLVRGGRRTSRIVKPEREEAVEDDGEETEEEEKVEKKRKKSSVKKEKKTADKTTEEKKPRSRQRKSAAGEEGGAELGSSGRSKQAEKASKAAERLRRQEEFKKERERKEQERRSRSKVRRDPHDDMSIGATSYDALMAESESEMEENTPHLRRGALLLDLINDSTTGVMTEAKKKEVEKKAARLARRKRRATRTKRRAQRQALYEEKLREYEAALLRGEEAEMPIPEPDTDSEDEEEPAPQPIRESQRDPISLDADIPDTNFGITTPAANFGPQVTIIDGIFVPDESSLYVTEVEEEEHREIVYRDTTTHVTQASFMNRAPSSKWTENEVKLLYRLLGQYGTDFGFISQYFPKKEIRQVKAKFKREQKTFPHIVALALANKLNIDDTEFQRVTGHFKTMRNIAVNAERQAEVDAMESSSNNVDSAPTGEAAPATAPAAETDGPAVVEISGAQKMKGKKAKAWANAPVSTSNYGGASSFDMMADDDMPDTNLF